MYLPQPSIYCDRMNTTRIIRNLSGLGAIAFGRGTATVRTLDVQYSIEEYEHMVQTQTRAVYLERGLAGFVRPISGVIPAELVTERGFLMLSDGARVPGAWLGADGKFVCSGPVIREIAAS